MATDKPGEAAGDDFEWVAEQFADLRILRYQVPGFEALDLKTKQLAYHLYEAALAGRDITWDQKYRHNLLVRATLEAIDKSYTGDRTSESFAAFQTYLKRVWFSSGIHHHYSTKKFVPGFTAGAFAALVANSDAAILPLMDGQTAAALATELTPILFDPTVGAQGVQQDPKHDMVVSSANNFYRGVTQAEVEAFYKARAESDGAHAVMHGLNSRLEKRDGALVEEIWKADGLYGPAIRRIVVQLRLASGFAENAAQKKAIDRLVTYYESGDLKDFDAYSVAWVEDTDSVIDNVNGFIESYGDAMDMRGTYEALLSMRDPEATKRIEAISAEADWFEANSPIAEAHKKAEVKGIDAKVITVIVGAGDTQPTFPIGVNLPNSDWIRKEHGSKSVSLGNIVHAYEAASKSGGLVAEFSPSPEIAAREKLHGDLADKLHTDMHEVIGHASGQINAGVGSTSETLKNYASTLEEARADLVALYFMLDPKLIELGVMPSLDVGRAGYDGYIRNSLLSQLARVELGDVIEQAHMRNRAIIARWAMDKGKGVAEGGGDVITQGTRDGKTIFVIHDYDALQSLFGDLLREIQRIKSEGDYDAGKALVANYGVSIDPVLHKEVRERYAKLGIAPYSGFINPRLEEVRDADGDVVDVKVTHPTSFSGQMHTYADKYGVLPVR